MANKKYLFLLIWILLLSISCNKTDILTKQEKEWLKKHPDLVVGISANAPPYQFVDKKGKINGIFVEFLELIEAKIDYKFKRVYSTDFSKFLTDIRTGSISVLLEIQKTDAREKYMNFTPTLLSHKHVIVVRKSDTTNITIEDLKEKKIAVTNLYATHEYFLKNYPDYQIFPFNDDVTCLRAVSSGLTDVYVSQQSTATYYIENEGISNLKIAGEIDYTNELSIASTQKYDTLNIILTKAVNSITKQQKQSIYSNWLLTQEKHFYQKARFWILVVVIFAAIILIVIFFNIFLTRKVRKKTKELKEAKDISEKNEMLIQKQYQELKLTEEEIKSANEELLTARDKLLEINTELAQAKKQAEESELHYRSTIELAVDGIILGDENGDIINVNSTACQMSGYSRSEILGKNIKEIILENDQYSKPLRYDLLMKGEIITSERNLLCKDGTKLPIEMRSRQMPNKTFQTFVRNITERKKMIDELREAKQRAENSDRLKTEFINNMSHEIRTPMNGIMGFSRLLDKENLSSEKIKMYTNIIINSGNQLMHIIDDILEISKLETKQVKTHNTEICLNDLLLEQFSIFDIKAKEKRVPLYLKKGLNDQESRILTDEVKLVKIIGNLLENALKFTSEGYVELSYNLIKKDEKEFIQIYVKDTGIGIRPEKQEAIFQRFSQEDDELSLKVGGLGLGLAIAKENTELLGGNITLESEKGKGSTFFVTIPYKPVNATSNE